MKKIISCYPDIQQGMVSGNMVITRASNLRALNFVGGTYLFEKRRHIEDFIVKNYPTR